MSVSTSTVADPPREPAWDIARLFPDQGTWSVDDYYELTNSTARHVQLDNSNIEVHAMPTEAHELILRYLFFAFHNFASRHKLGSVFFAGIRIRTVESKYRVRGWRNP